ERLTAGVLDFSLVARAVRVHSALPQRGDVGLAHSWSDLVADVLEGERGELVRQPHALELLLGLDSPRLDEQRRRVDAVRERVEPCGRVRRRLADHAVGGLGALAELAPNPRQPTLPTP